VDCGRGRASREAGVRELGFAPGARSGGGPGAARRVGHRSTRGGGFNCVRLTWATYLATNATLASLPLRWSLERLGMLESVAGVRVNNPALLDLPLVDVFRVRGFFAQWSTQNCI